MWQVLAAVIGIDQQAHRLRQQLCQQRTLLQWPAKPLECGCPPGTCSTEHGLQFARAGLHEQHRDAAQPHALMQRPDADLENIAHAANLGLTQLLDTGSEDAIGAGVRRLWLCREPAARLLPVSEQFCARRRQAIVTTMAPVIATD